MPPTGNLQHSVATSAIIEELDLVLQPVSDQLAPSITDKHVRFALERVHFDLDRSLYISRSAVQPIYCCNFSPRVRESTNYTDRRPSSHDFTLPKDRQPAMTHLLFNTYRREVWRLRLLSGVGKSVAQPVCVKMMGASLTSTGRIRIETRKIPCRRRKTQWAGWIVTSVWRTVGPAAPDTQCFGGRKADGRDGRVPTRS